MTELLFLKFNLASPLATDANVRMSKSEESSRNYHVETHKTRIENWFRLVLPTKEPFYLKASAPTPYYCAGNNILSKQWSIES